VFLACDGAPTKEPTQARLLTDFICLSFAEREKGFASARGSSHAATDQDSAERSGAIHPRRQPWQSPQMPFLVVTGRAN